MDDRQQVWVEESSTDFRYKLEMHLIYVTRCEVDLCIYELGIKGKGFGWGYQFENG